MSAAGHLADPIAARGLTLGDFLLPADVRGRWPALVQDAVLVMAGALLLVVCARISFTVPAVQLGQLFVPVNEYVPLTLQTFGVLFTGALLGAGRGMAATALYLAIGIIGFPVFSADAQGVHRSGLETFVAFGGGRAVLGSTGGYLLGFLVASAVVGGLAQRGWDRRLAGSLGAMLLGSLIIYVFGVVWLANAADLDLASALTFGLWPFLPGDILKLLIAAGLLPLGWRLVSRRASERRGDTASGS